MHPDSLAYVIYTSGSTGRPKGVRHPHRGRGDVPGRQRPALGGAAATGCSQFAPVGFDVAGARDLRAADRRRDARPRHRDERPAPAGARGRCAAERSPSPARRPVGSCAALPTRRGLPGLRGARRRRGAAAPRWPTGPRAPARAAAGQPLRPDRGDRLGHRRRGSARRGRPPIGRPIAGNDRATSSTPGCGRCRSACPASCTSAAPGWPAATSAGPELTAERFVPDPFAAEPGRAALPHRRPRRGGARRRARVPRPDRPPGEDPRLPDRAGRGRGGAAPAPGRARRRCVVARDAAGPAPRWSPTSAGDGMPAELRDFLAARAAGATWCRPRSCRLAALPLTANGKVDRAALPAPEPGGGRVDAAPSRRAPPAEADGWPASGRGARRGPGRRARRLLRPRRALAARHPAGLAAARRFGVDVPLREVYRRRTWPRVAALVAPPPARRPGCARRAAPARAGPAVPLSFRSSGSGSSISWPRAPGLQHRQVSVRLRGPLDRAALGGALNEIVARHEVLRTRFVEVGGVPVRSRLRR